MDVFAGLLLPFAGTTLGAMAVFLMKSSLKKTVEQLLLGVASGVMLAASVWSLLLPSLALATQQNLPAWLPAAAGFLLGVGVLLALDRLFPQTNQSTVLFFAVTLHNIPEGMAVGVALAGALLPDAGITMAAALTLSFGIAVQNFPEGAIISMPLRSVGVRKGHAFLLGTLSGAVEPVAAAGTMLLTAAVTCILPYMLAFAAGAMICVVVKDLIPAAQGKPRATIGAAAGFLTMMILDVALG